MNKTNALHQSWQKIGYTFSCFLSKLPIGQACTLGEEGKRGFLPLYKFHFLRFSVITPSPTNCWNSNKFLHLSHFLNFFLPTNQPGSWVWWGRSRGAGLDAPLKVSSTTPRPLRLPRSGGEWGSPPAAAARLRPSAGGPFRRDGGGARGLDGCPIKIDCRILKDFRRSWSLTDFPRYRQQLFETVWIF